MMTVEWESSNTLGIQYHLIMSYDVSSFCNSCDNIAVRRTKKKQIYLLTDIEFISSFSGNLFCYHYQMASIFSQIVVVFVNRALSDGVFQLARKI